MEVMASVALIRAQTLSFPLNPSCLLFGFVERLVSEAAIFHFDSNPLRIHPYDLLEAIRNRLLNFFYRKLDNLARRMKTPVPDRLLLRRKFNVLAN